MTEEVLEKLISDFMTRCEKVPTHVIVSCKDMAIFTATFRRRPDCMNHTLSRDSRIVGYYGYNAQVKFITVPGDMDPYVIDIGEY